MQLPGIGYGRDQHRDWGGPNTTGPRYRPAPVAAVPFAPGLGVKSVIPITHFCKKSRGEAKSSAGIFHSRDRPEHRTRRSRAPLLALTTHRQKV